MTTEFRLLDFHISNDSYEDGEEDSSYSREDTRKFVIQMFGLDETGRTYSVFVEDFQPFLYLKVGDHWTQSTKTAFLGYIKKRIGTLKSPNYYNNSITDCRLLKRQKLYGFDNKKKYKFLRFTFTNTIAMNKVKNLFYYNRVKYWCNTKSGALVMKTLFYTTTTTRKS